MRSAWSLECIVSHSEAAAQVGGRVLGLFPFPPGEASSDWAVQEERESIHFFEVDD